MGEKNLSELWAGFQSKHKKWFSSNLNPDGEALSKCFSLCLAFSRDRGGGRGSDGDGAVSDVLADRAMHLSIGCLNGRCQGFHAVNAFSGVGESLLGADARSLARASVHVSILG